MEGKVIHAFLFSWIRSYRLSCNIQAWNQWRDTDVQEQFIHNTETKQRDSSNFIQVQYVLDKQLELE